MRSYARCEFLDRRKKGSTNFIAGSNGMHGTDRYLAIYLLTFSLLGNAHGSIDDY